ncbi:MAG: response regulator [Lentisphaerae bacterium]|nr:response regulator [Lentisphaerota bacterium]
MKDKPRILVVDDQPQNIELLEARLVPRGYEIVKAANGEEALEKVSGNNIDLILLDVIMPGMNGYEVMRRLKMQEANRNIPVIFLSALTETEQRVAGLKFGAVDFISKPYRTEELLARVQTHLELRRLRIQLEGQAADLRQANEQLQWEIVERKKMEEEERQKANALQEAMDKIQALTGLLPICMHCKKIRDGKGQWNQLEKYVSEHSNTEFSHGVCEDCQKKFYPNLKF